jgi:hypothetical protein
MMMMMMMIYTENEDPAPYIQQVNFSGLLCFPLNSFVNEFILPQSPILSICIRELVKIFYQYGRTSLFKDMSFVCKHLFGLLGRVIGLSSATKETHEAQ